MQLLRDGCERIGCDCIAILLTDDKADELFVQAPQTELHTAID